MRTEERRKKKKNENFQRESQNSDMNSPVLAGMMMHTGSGAEFVA